MSNVEKLKQVPTEKLEQLLKLLKQIRKIETRKSSTHKKLESCFRMEIKRRKK